MNIPFGFDNQNLNEAFLFIDSDLIQIINNRIFYQILFEFIEDYNETMLYLNFLEKGKTGLSREKFETLQTKIVKDSNDFCSICRENYVKNEILLQLPCNHFYHKLCIQKWFEKTTKCPLCRKEV